MSNSLDTTCSSTTQADNRTQEQLNTLLGPIRLKLYTTLQQARIISEVAEITGVDRKSIYYHLKVMTNIGLAAVYGGLK